MRQEDFKSCEIFSKSPNQCFRAQQPFPVSVTWVRGRDVTMRSGPARVKLLGRQFLPRWPAPASPSWVVFQFCEAFAPQAPHQWLSLLVICSQRRYPCSLWTVSTETQTLCQQNDSSCNVRFRGWWEASGEEGQWKQEAVWPLLRRTVVPRCC